MIYRAIRNLDRARHHYSESIRRHEAQGVLYGAAQARYNVAVTLMDFARFAEARNYAETAARNFQTYGPGAADEVQRTLALVAVIAKAATS